MQNTFETPILQSLYEAQIHLNSLSSLSASQVIQISVFVFVIAMRLSRGDHSRARTVRLYSDQKTFVFGHFSVCQPKLTEAHMFVSVVRLCSYRLKFSRS